MSRRNAEGRVAVNSKAQAGNNNGAGFIPLKRRDCQACPTTLLDESQVSLLLLLESGLDEVKGLDKDAGTEPGDSSTQQVGDWIASFLL